MRKISFLCIVLMLLALPASVLAARNTPELADWDWLVARVAAGESTIELPNSMVRSEGQAGLVAKDAVRIKGNGYTLTEAVVSGGQVIFEDTRMTGAHGVGDESGSAALTLRGEGTIVALMGACYVEGGPSGQQGEAGGHGILMADDGQGLIVSDTTTVMGGTGRLYGGDGVHVAGCDSSVLAAQSASVVGNPGLVQGGHGINAPECAKVTVSQQAAVTGGGAPYTAGHGLRSVDCADCDAQGTVSVADMAMAIGGVGKEGGSGIYLSRTERGEMLDLRLEGSCMLIGADGTVAGAALHAQNAAIFYDGDGIQLYGGRYYETATDAKVLINCTEENRGGELIVVEGAQTASFPAGHLSTVISTAIHQQSDRYVPEVIEDGLSTMDLQTKLNGLRVERGTTAQVKVSDSSLKIFMYNGTLEKRNYFQQWLMSDGAEGTRLVLIGAEADEWPTIDATVAGLRKLLSLDITQIAYTCVAPVYHERVLDIEALLVAVDADAQGDVARVMCGTADDAVIFLRENGEKDYQETLMQEVMRPVR